MDEHALTLWQQLYPSGKPMIQHLLRSQGIGVNDYSLTLDALPLLHPRLLQR
jgi:hypothetical protein